MCLWVFGHRFYPYFRCLNLEIDLLLTMSSSVAQRNGVEPADISERDSKVAKRYDVNSRPTYELKHPYHATTTVNTNKVATPFTDGVQSKKIIPRITTSHPRAII